MEKTAGSSKVRKQSKTSRHQKNIKDVERGVAEEDLVIGLYNSAYSGKDWTYEYMKFWDMTEQERISLKLNQLVALNVAATRSNWRFIAHMLRQMSVDERAAVLTTNHSRADLEKVKSDMKKYLSMKDDTDYSEIMKFLNGSPEYLLLTAAASRKFEVTFLLANNIHIEHPARSGIILYDVVVAGFYDVAYILCERYPKLSVAPTPTNIKLEDGQIKVVSRNDSTGRKREDVGVDVAIAGNKNSADLNISESPSATRGPTILVVLATGRSAFRSSSNHEGQIMRYFVSWLLNLLKTQETGYISSLKDVIYGVLFHFLVPIWILVEHIFTDCKTYREEEQRYQHVELLLEIIKKEIEVNKNEYFEELRTVIKVAARKGIAEIVGMCLEIFPGLIREGDTPDIFHYAIKFRHEKVFNIVRDKLLGYGLKVKTWVVSHDCDDMLMLAAEMPPQSSLEDVTGSALQVQRELHWFEEVEEVAFTLNHQKASDSKEDAYLEFVKSHKALLEKGEEWVKSAATSGTVVAALIVTVVYQAAFQIPGGTDESKEGSAKLLARNITAGIQHMSAAEVEFFIFTASDIISLFFSSTSLLMFLCILTSRFAARDFSFDLPNRLILGYTSLLIGLAAMMASYTATMFIVLGEDMMLFKYLALCAVAIPVTLFVFMQLPLYVAFAKSTYQGKSVFEHKIKGMSFWGSLFTMYCRCRYLDAFKGLAKKRVLKTRLPSIKPKGAPETHS